MLYVVWMQMLLMSLTYIGSQIAHFKSRDDFYESLDNKTIIINVNIYRELVHQGKNDFCLDYSPDKDLLTFTQCHNLRG